MKVNFYESASGQSPVEKFIEALPKPERVRFAEVIVGLEEQGLSYSRAQFANCVARFGRLNTRLPVEGIEWRTLLFERKKW